VDLHEERDDDGVLGCSGISWTIYANNVHLAPGGEGLGLGQEPGLAREPSVR